jgi:hypothetical protein
MNLWSLPIFALIGTVCFVIVALLQLYRMSGRVSYRIESRPRPRRNGGWAFAERVAVIMGIVSFIIQVAQWIYPWL